jgi:subtilisin-like proprotein convertase family protein
MKRFLILTTVCCPLTAPAALTFSESWVVSSLIPDNDPVGYSDTRTITTDIAVISDVSVDLVFTGGWNGDLYAYLVHDSGFSVLLNRVGLSLGMPDGSSGAGMTLALNDAAAEDVHLAAPLVGTFSGTFQPDGRLTDPSLVLDTDPRTAMLSSFVNLDGNGDWTLFVADVSPGSTSTLQSWSLNLTGVIPEPGVALLLAGGLPLLLRRRR